MPSEKKSASASKFAFYSNVAALLAFVACNGLILVTALLAMLGITLGINPHVQAVLIVLFAVLTSAFILGGYVRHRRIGPPLLAAAGTLVIVLTLYVSYSKLIESAALLALVAAAGWNWLATRRQSARVQKIDTTHTGNSGRD